MAGRRSPLSRERVLRAALDLVDMEGVEALTMRRLGRELGIEAMSLYGYVRSKQDLIEGVVEQVFRQMPLIVPGPGTWQDRVRRHAAAYRQVLLDHPNAVRLVAGRPVITEGTAAFVESALAELTSMGLELELADRVLGVIASFTLGLVSEQVGNAGRGEATRPLRDAISPERFPYVSQLDEMKPVDYDHEFELGLDFIVAGLERLLETNGQARDDDDTGYDKIIG
jgi:AcrR family transcriptional regulator